MKGDKEPKTHAERQKAYHRRMREEGMVRVSHWIPDVEDARDALARAVRRIVKKYG